MIDHSHPATRLGNVDLPLSPFSTDMSQTEDTLLPRAVLSDSDLDVQGDGINLGLRATHTRSVDLAALHIEMDHLARSYWDIQKTRQMIQNRVKRLTDAAGPFGGMLLDVGNLTELQHVLEAQETRLERQLATLAKQHPLAPWVERTRGIGLPGFARLMGVTGSLDRFSNPAKLWKFLGLGLVNGETQHRRQGESWTHTDCKHGHLTGVCKPDCRTDHHPDCRPGVEGNAYSPQGRVMVFQIIDSTIRLRGEYRPVYDEAKARYETKERVGPSDCPTGLHHRSKAGRTVRCPKAHIDRLARRIAAKRLLRDMWREWHLARSVTHH